MRFQPAIHIFFLRKLFFQHQESIIFPKTLPVDSKTLSPGIRFWDILFWDNKINTSLLMMSVHCLDTGCIRKFTPSGLGGWVSHSHHLIQGGYQDISALELTFSSPLPKTNPSHLMLRECPYTWDKLWVFFASYANTFYQNLWLACSALISWLWTVLNIKV